MTAMADKKENIELLKKCEAKTCPSVSLDQINYKLLKEALLKNSLNLLS